MDEVGFCLFHPTLGWWCGRPGPKHVDVFSDRLADACILGREELAAAQAAALCDAYGSSMFWIYQVTKTRRRVGRRW